ncbi:RNA polymerase sigma factor [Corynebacterium heidelbergense]|uniref:RNA polymerase subunit sigma-24 n=1 Tax=Corynebacterium heidelbergense TaxID=2055947 RepID=A0A364VDE2_9CORY|nr:RNA polymerase sigma factor [Corynebacterium heidelbergense]RAV34665.1 RNA polymerase subunit sigma-24 [Corynebacterium heidelbergense]WCZ36237.1 ECF RNA polymerase sigma factor SigW [Corynebacterium heidelbergense]
MHRSSRYKDDGDAEKRLSIAKKISAGDERGLREAHDLWHSLLYNIAYRALGSKEDAEEAVQLTFFGAWRSRHTLKVTDSSLPGWLVGILKNTIADVRKLRYRSKLIFDKSIEEATQSALSETFDVALRMTLVNELSSLGQPRSAIMWLSLVEGLSSQKISERLNVPLGTVKSHIRRTIPLLRSRLADILERK